MRKKKPLKVYSSTAAFVIPYRGSKDPRCLSYFEKAIRSIEAQTDPDWKASGSYRVCRWRKDSAGNRNSDFNHLKRINDTKGFRNALRIASQYRDFSPEEIDDLTVRFYVRLAVTIANGGSEAEAFLIMRDTLAISEDRTLDAISQIIPEEYRVTAANLYRKARKRKILVKIFLSFSGRFREGCFWFPV